MDIVASTDAGKPGPVHKVIESARQCPAPAYGSAFSRAVELPLWGNRLMYVSGTASIDEEGRTRDPESAPAQIRRTCDVLEALLGTSGLRLRDAAASIAYCKTPEVFAEWRRSPYNSTPTTIPVYSDVCRPDLLFEIEASALIPEPSAEGRRP
jgi:enamine deaminase RidA (YjgF/YER057c/UK114 family)